MFFDKIKDKLYSFIFHRAKARQVKFLLALLICFYIALFVLVAVKKYYFFSYNVSDLAIFNQTFFNTLQGNWFVETIIGTNLLAAHLSPIIILLLPIYALWPTPLNLLIMQTIGLALAAWPLFCLTRYLTHKDNLALLVALAWLLNPVVHWANLDESHLFYLLPFLVFWAAYFYQQNKFKYFLLFFILALFLREDVALSLLAWSAIAYLDKKDKKWIFTTLILPLVYFVLALSIIKLFAQGDNYKFLVFYNWLGGKDLPSIIWAWFSQPVALWQHLFSGTNLAGLVFIFLLFLALPLIRPKYLLLSLLPFLQLALNVSGFSQGAYTSRFGLLILPGLFLALVFSLQHIQEKKDFFGSKFIYKNFAFSKLVFIFTLVYFVINVSPVWGLLVKKFDVADQARKMQALSSIPAQASVIATNNFLAPLSNRSEIYSLDYAYVAREQFGHKAYQQPAVDFILVDYSDFLTNISDVQNSPFYKQYWPQVPSQWRNFLLDYSLVKAENNILLWQNKQAVPGGLKFYELKSKTKVAAEPKFLFTPASILNQTHRVLKLDIQEIGEPTKNYLVRFYYDHSYFDLPLDYGLMSAQDWQENQASFYYYLDDQVVAYQIFAWQGLNIAGLQQEIYLDKKLEAISDKLYFTNN